MLIGGTLLAIGLAVVLALVLTNDIVDPVTRLATTAQAIAGGQLYQRVGLKRADEVGMAANAFDRMTEQLQATIVRSEAILDTAAEGIVGLDQAGRVTFINPSAVRMLGSTEAELLGQEAAAWLAPPPTDDAERGRVPTMPPLSARRGGLGGEVSPVAGGEGSRTPPSRRPSSAAPPKPARPSSPAWTAVPPLPIEYACAPLREFGEVRGAVLTFRDVTERRAAQRILEDRNRELGRSNADLEQFAYVASHDLQEPLRAVVSYLQLLERRYAEQLDERAVRYIGHAVEGGHRMQKLINDLLTYSRVGRRGEELTEVEFRTIFDRALTSLQIAIEESEAVVTYEEPLPTIVADADPDAPVDSEPDRQRYQVPGRGRATHSRLCRANRWRMAVLRPR